MSARCQSPLPWKLCLAGTRSELTANEESSRATIGQAGATSKPQTHTNRGAQGNHSNVPTAEFPLQLTVGTVVDHNAMLDVMMPVM